MPKQERKAVDTTTVSVEEKIARTLALLLVKGLDNEEASVRLSGAGFDASQISEMLLVNKNFVHVAKNRWKKRQKSKSTKLRAE